MSDSKNQLTFNMFFSKNSRRKEGRQLVNADFSESSLVGQDYTETDCRQANFSKSDLRSVKFRKANLSGAKLNEAKIGLRPCYNFLFIIILLFLSGLSGIVSGYSGASFKIVIDSIIDYIQTDQPLNTIISLLYLISILFLLFFSVKKGIVCICLLIVTGVLTSLLWVIFIGYWHLASAGAWAYSWVIASGGFIAIISCETTLWIITRSIYIKSLFILSTSVGIIAGVLTPSWAISGGDIISAIGESGYWCMIWSFGMIFITQYVHNLIVRRIAFSVFEEVSIRVISKYGTDFYGANLTNADFTGVDIKNSCFINITPNDTDNILGFYRDRNTSSSFRRTIVDELELRKENENLSKEIQELQKTTEKIQRAIEKGFTTEANFYNYINNTNKNETMRDKNTFCNEGDVVFANDNSTVNHYRFTSQQAKNLYSEIERIVEQAEGTIEEKAAAQDILKKTGQELEKSNPDNEKIHRYLTVIQKLLPTVAGLPWEKIIQGVKALTGL